MKMYGVDSVDNRAMRWPAGKVVGGGRQVTPSVISSQYDDECSN